MSVQLRAVVFRATSNADGIEALKNWFRKYSDDDNERENFNHALESVNIHGVYAAKGHEAASWAATHQCRATSSVMSSRRTSSPSSSL